MAANDAVLIETKQDVDINDNDDLDEKKEELAIVVADKDKSISDSDRKQVEALLCRQCSFCEKSSNTETLYCCTQCFKSINPNNDKSNDYHILCDRCGQIRHENKNHTFDDNKQPASKYLYPLQDIVLGKRIGEESILKALRESYNSGLATGLIVTVDTLSAVHEGVTEPLHSAAVANGLTGLAYGFYGVAFVIELCIIGFNYRRGNINSFEAKFRLGKCGARLAVGFGTAKLCAFIGGLAGAAAGPIGILAGAIIGGILGGLGGSVITSWIAETKVWPWLKERFPDLAKPEQVKSYI